MAIETNIALEKRLQSIERKLDQLINQQNKKTWVKVSIITEVTGWNGDFLRKARENGLVKYRDNNGYEYLLESINPLFIKPKIA